MLWFFLFFAWISLLISILADILRSDLSGGGKAVWVLFVIVLPLLGCLIYLTVHGNDMQQRTLDHSRRLEGAQRDYIQSVAGTGSNTADELAKLAQLRDQGVVTEQEFAAQKAKLLA
jgi:hypothetical protein